MLKLGVAALRRAAGSLPCLEGLVSIGGNEVLRRVLKKLFGDWRLADTRTGESHVDDLHLFWIQYSGGLQLIVALLQCVIAFQGHTFIV